MGKAIVDNKLPNFKRSANGMMRLALRDAANDIWQKAVDRAPLSATRSDGGRYSSGYLRSQSGFDMRTPTSYRVSFWAEYARYQEFGGDGRRVVRNYTTAGTGAHYLRDSGNEVARDIARRFKKFGMRARP